VVDNVIDQGRVTEMREGRVFLSQGCKEYRQDGLLGRPPGPVVSSTLPKFWRERGACHFPTQARNARAATKRQVSTSDSFLAVSVALSSLSNCEDRMVVDSEMIFS
jgi:hypothetical protein